MSSRLNPYIAFDGNAREAMESYRDVFGGDLVINTFGEYRNPDPALADKTMHAQLETDRSFTLMASDGPPGAEPTKGDNISISLSGDDADDSTATGTSCPKAAPCRCLSRGRPAGSRPRATDRPGDELAHMSWCCEMSRPKRIVGPPG